MMTADSKARRARDEHRQTRCAMVLPSDLQGRRVLDLGCRNGLGAFKIADRVGVTGFVVGVDPDSSHIAQAVAQAPNHHWAGEKWQNYLRFACADATNLSAAGIEEGGFDVVVVNSVLNLSHPHIDALKEIVRALVPGGYLYHDAAIANTPLPKVLSDRCRVAGNVFGTALTRDEFSDQLKQAGFTRWEFAAIEPLAPARGDVIDDLKPYSFCSAVLQAWA